MINYIKNNKLGTVTLVLSLTFILLGLPDQILKIWRTKNIVGISVFSFSLLGIQSFFWVLYGSTKKDWFIILPNVFAVLFATVIVLEYFIYR